MKKTAAQSLSLAFIMFAAPLIASAQALQPIRNLIVAVGSILNITIPVLIAAAIVVFFWGLVQYIRTSGEGHAEGRNVMIAGLISLFIMVSVWGLVNLAQNALGVSGSASVQIPQVPTASY
jgi:Na+-driven multidrug efflux pump